MATGFPTYTVELELTAGVWTDITTQVVGDSIEITIGKDSPNGDIQPGVLDLVLDNADGSWTPDNPLSASYPNFIEGKRIRVVLNKGTPAGYSTGSYGTGPYAGTLTQSARFVGRIVLIEPDFPDDPTQSQTRVQAVDALGDLSRNVMPPSLLPLLQAEHATWDFAGLQAICYWPLRGGYRYQDTVTGAINLTVHQPTAGGALQWEADSSFPIASDQAVSMTSGVGLTFTPRPPQAPAGGSWLAGIGVVVLLNAGSSGAFLAMLDSKPGSPTVGGISAEWDGVGTISLKTYTAGVATTVATVPAAPGWHVVSYDINPNNFYVDGQTYTPTGSNSATLTSVYLGGQIDISARDLFGSQGNLLTAHSYLLSVGQSLATVIANTATQAGAAAMGSTVGWTTAVTGVTATPPATDGRSAVDVISDIANSQSGLAYVAYSLTDPQPVTLVANVDNRTAAVALTLDAQDDLSGGPTLDRNVLEKVAAATAKNSTDAVTVTDASLANRYGSATAEIQTVLASLNALAAVASDQIAQSKSSKLRLSQVTFDLATAANDLYSNWFGLAPGERVRVTNLPSAYFGVTQIDGYVLGWKERPRLDGYEVTLNLQPADAPAQARYDDTVYGRFAWGDGKATVTGGTAIASTAPGTLIITTPTGPCLTTSAGAYPMQLDWNGECVTIGAAPASSSSPQTVTITARGVNGTVARNHSAGEPIEIWRAARFAL